MTSQDESTVGLSRQRLEALSDGVYSVALTLLVLDLKIPATGFGGDNAAFMLALQSLVPNALTWLLSFWVIATFWVAQVRVLQMTRAIDWTILWSELAQLALVSLLPFSTSLIAEHSDHVASAVIYSLNLTGISLLSLLRALHVLRTPALHLNAIAPEMAWALRVGGWGRLACCVATLVLAFFWPGWNMLAMLPMSLLRRYIAHGRPGRTIEG